MGILAVHLETRNTGFVVNIPHQSNPLTCQQRTLLHYSSDYTDSPASLFYLFAFSCNSPYERHPTLGIKDSS